MASRRSDRPAADLPRKQRRVQAIRDDVSQFDRIFAAAAEALSRTEVVTLRLRIGSGGMALRLAGRAIADKYLPALADGLRAPGPSDLDVIVWDSGESGVPFPSLDDGPANAAAPRDEDRSIEKVYQRGVETFTAIDHQGRRAVVWVPDAHAVPTNEVACPMRILFHLWGRRQGVHLLHGGAVGLDTGGVLIAGRSGIGKSTIALSCLGNGLSYAGDDYVMVTTTPVPRAHALYTSGKLQPDQLPRFGHLHSARINPGADDKPVFLLKSTHGRHLASGFPLRAIVVPRVTGASEPRLLRTRPALAVAAIAPSTVFQLPYSGVTTMGVAAELASRLPTYTLEMGARLDLLPDLLLGLLRSADV